MSRIAACFAALKAQGKKALIPYITAGDPTLEITLTLMHKLVEAGADILELGIPFSDPMADGSVIQLACERALLHNTSLHQVLALVRTFRATNNHTPVVLMGYMNPFEVMGAEIFAKDASEAGVDGVLTVDMPPEESEEVLVHYRAKGLDSIFLLAPTTSVARMKLICEKSSGFVYYVSLKGVTGAANLDLTEVAAKMKEIGAVTALPIGVGFGIRDAASAASVAQLSDAVVVGSAIVRKIQDNLENTDKMVTEISEFIRGIRQAMDQK